MGGPGVRGPGAHAPMVPLLFRHCLLALWRHPCSSMVMAALIKACTLAEARASSTAADQSPVDEECSQGRWRVCYCCPCPLSCQHLSSLLYNIVIQSIGKTGDLTKPTTFAFTHADLFVHGWRRLEHQHNNRFILQRLRGIDIDDWIRLELRAVEIVRYLILLYLCLNAML